MTTYEPLNPLLFVQAIRSPCNLIRPVNIVGPFIDHLRALRAFRRDRVGHHLHGLAVILRFTRSLANMLRMVASVPRGGRLCRRSLGLLQPLRRLRGSGVLVLRRDIFLTIMHNADFDELPRQEWLTQLVQ